MFHVKKCISNLLLLIVINIGMNVPLRSMKNAFYFMLKALFAYELLKFLSWFLGYVEKQLDKRAMVNFKTYDFTDEITNNFNTHIAQYLKN